MFKLALVTGATSGIGAAFAELLAEKGISLIITGRDAEKLEILSKKLNARSFIAHLDQPEGVLLVTAHIHHHKPDLVVNCAGFGYYGEAAKMSIPDHESIINVNIRAVVDLTVAAADTMQKNNIKGTVLNVSSSAPFFPCPYFATYGATKAFVNTFSEALDFELAGQGIRVLAACPGLVATQFADRAAKKKVEKVDYQALVLTPELVAQEMWLQIQQGKRVKIIDWKYRLLSWIVKFIPRFAQANVVKNSIQHRLE